MELFKDLSLLLLTHVVRLDAKELSVQLHFTRSGEGTLFHWNTLAAMHQAESAVRNAKQLGVAPRF